ncbi:MAG: glycine/sarcosine/betaine reductase selenoprotein B family protein [Hyphomicrobiaceae bacterium]
MAHIQDIPQGTRDAILALEIATPTPKPFVSGPPLSERRVAIVSSAALHAKDEPPFLFGSPEFRELKASLPVADIRMSHVSINYDRQGFQRDINVAYPIERLKELAAEGIVGAVSDTHYAVMGSTDPKTMSETVEALLARFRRDRIDAVLFSPV